MCAAFAEVANMAAYKIESSNLVFNWIENVREDLSKVIPCGDNEVTIVTGQGSCSVEVETVRDPVARRRKGWTGERASADCDPNTREQCCYSISKS
ncbi:hypothetical protein AB3S75_036701 [Citrus x aurantiifolia]